MRRYADCQRKEAEICACKAALAMQEVSASLISMQPPGVLDNRCIHASYAGESGRGVRVCRSLKYSFFLSRAHLVQDGAYRSSGAALFSLSVHADHVFSCVLPNLTAISWRKRNLSSAHHASVIFSCSCRQALARLPPLIAQWDLGSLPALSTLNLTGGTGVVQNSVVLKGQTWECFPLNPHPDILTGPEPVSSLSVEQNVGATVKCFVHG